MVFRRTFKRRFKSRPKFNRMKKKAFIKGRTAYHGSTRVFKLKQIQSVVTSVGGAIASVEPLRDPSGSENWLDIAAVFDEYRVDYLKIQYIPHLLADPSTVIAFRPLYTCVDYDDETTPGSIGLVLQYDNQKSFDLRYKWKLFVNLKFKDRKQPWIDIAAVANRKLGGVKLIADNLSSSTTYGTMVITYYVRYRGIR